MSRFRLKNPDAADRLHEWAMVNGFSAECFPFEAIVQFAEDYAAWERRRADHYEQIAVDLTNSAPASYVVPFFGALEPTIKRIPDPPPWSPETPFSIIENITREEAMRRWPSSKIPDPPPT